MELIRGDSVKHPNMPQWGIGIVLDTSPDYINVFFRKIDERKAFSRDDNLLEKVESSGDEVTQLEEVEIQLYGSATVEERVVRDLANARLAIELAKEDREFVNSDTHCLATISVRPFDAMMEVNGNQLWYANQYTTTNMALGDDGNRVVILTWTHPGVQLALAGELLETYDIASNQYTLTEVTTKARAKFKQVLPEII